MQFNIPGRVSPMLGLALESGWMRFLRLKQRLYGNQIACRKEIQYAGSCHVFTSVSDFAEIKNRLHQVVRELSLTGCSVVVNLPLAMVQLKSMKLPAAMTDDELLADAILHAEQSLSARHDKLCVDYFVNQKINDEVEIYYAASRQSTIEHLRKLMHAIELKLVVVEVDVFALIRAARFCQKTHAGEAVCLLYFSGASVLIAAWEHNRFLFCRQKEFDWDGLSDREWLSWCHAPNQQSVHQLLIAGDYADVRQAALLAEHWNCPLTELSLDSVVNDKLSQYLLAFGLAMRRREPWSN